MRYVMYMRKPWNGERRRAVEGKLLFGRKAPPSFEELAARAEEGVYRTCFHMMGNEEDAADCAQETMLRAYRAFSSFRREAAFSTWITRIALRVCTDALRKRRPILSLDAMRGVRRL